MEWLKLHPKTLSLLLGALCVLGFAPYHYFIAPVIGLACLFYFWHHSDSPIQAANIGFIFGLGFFVAGIYWIYISLHDIGGMPFWMAGFATFCLCAFLSLFPAIVGYLAKRSPCMLICAPILWVLSEWVRNWIFTGFPWLAIGYSQVPTSPIVAYAPIFGVFGVGLAVTISAALLTSLMLNQKRQQTLVAICCIWIIATLLSMSNWTSKTGMPISVSLLQGNIPQEIKWNESVSVQTIQQYLNMVRQSRSDLVILPETALPFAIDIQQQDANQKQLLEAFRKHSQAPYQDILIGAVSKQKDDYFNSVLGMKSSNQTLQFYHKSHLVPFGEFIPMKTIFGWVYKDWLNMPLSDLSRGARFQSPMSLANQRVAINICYEDVFGEEIIRQLPQATLLVNVSNDAWYGHSNAASQHLQFSQMRALETGRMLLRATNTGETAIIDTKGKVVAALPQFTTAILNGTAQGYEGTTPYVRWGNWPIISVLFITLILLWGRKKK
jgi:apolipoprotein N-acyltransferase